MQACAASHAGHQAGWHYSGFLVDHWGHRRFAKPERRNGPGIARGGEREYVPRLEYEFPPRGSRIILGADRRQASMQIRAVASGLG
jgi:hypothetical protein